MQGLFVENGPRPQSRNRKCARVAADVGAGHAMASTELCHLDQTEKDTWEKLSLWDHRTDALAPLTEKQMDSVLELRSAAESVSIPSEVRSSQLASQLKFAYVLSAHQFKTVASNKPSIC